MGLILGPQRYSAVPWLSKSDLEEGRRALWEVDYQYDVDKASLWPVSNYDKACGSTAQYLLVRATRGNGNDGGTITLSLHQSPHFDVYAKEVFALQQTTKRARRFWPKDSNEEWR